MIRIIGICGSRVKDGNVEALLEETLSWATRHDGVETERVTLHDKEINGCNHCNWCVSKQSDSRYCVQEDDMDPIYPEILQADGIILASPAHFGRLSGHLANMIDRMRVFVHGNVHAKRLKNKIGGSLAVGFYRGGGIETTLFSINTVFHTLQLIVATSGLYHLGAGAVTSRDGKGRFEKEPRHMVLEDEFGIHSARILADRMVELARIVRAGEETLKSSEER